MAEPAKRWPEPADLESRYGAGRGGDGAQVFPPDDPVLEHLAQCQDVKVYEHLQELFPAAYAAWVQRRSVLLGKGWQVLPGEGPNGERNAEILRRMLGEVVDFETLLEELHLTMWNGYGVIVTSSIQDLKVDGRTFQAPWYMRRKPPYDFAFDTQRRLVWVTDPLNVETTFSTNEELLGDGDDPTDLFRFLVSAVGTDSPYGVGVARFLYQLWRIWRGSMKDTATGLRRALGVWKLNDHGPRMPAPGEGSTTGYTETEAAAMRDELAVAARRLDETGILSLPPGMDAELLKVSSYADQGVKFLRYADELASRVILSVSLTTTLDGQGSRAAAQVQLGPLVALCKADGRKMSAWIERYFHRWVELAIGSQMDSDDRPRFRFLLSEASDKELLQVLVAAGIPIDAEALATEAGVKLAPDEDDELVIRGSSPPPRDDPEEDEDQGGEAPPIEEGDEPEE
jgi:hypothetical protein